MDPAWNRHTRRSTPNLKHLAFSPLIEDVVISNPSSEALSHREDDEHASGYLTPRRTSYIQGRSAPTTPSILSRSSSHVRLHHSLHTTAGEFSSIPKSKSSSILLLSPSAARRPDHFGTKASSSTRTTSAHAEPSEWFLRAGAALTSEARESKGQGWLVSRESSTSLVQEASSSESEDDDKNNRFFDGRRGSSSLDMDRWHRRRRSSAGFYADDEFSPVSTRTSRAVSARNSRPGSRHGSRVDLFTHGHLQHGSHALRTPRDSRDRERTDYFDESDPSLMEPDFIIDPEEKRVAEEQEGEVERDVARLTRQRGFGLGGWVDRFIGWTLFEVDDEDADDDDDGNGRRERERLEEHMTRRRRREESERVVLKQQQELQNASSVPSIAVSTGTVGDTAVASAASVVTASATPETTTSDHQTADHIGLRDEEAGGGWQDAAWLLSVATKILI